MKYSECCCSQIKFHDICSECGEHCDAQELEIAIKRTTEQIYHVNKYEFIEHIKLWHGECEDCEINTILNSPHYTDERLIEEVYETDSGLVDSFIEKKTEHDKDCAWSEIPTNSERIELVFR